MYFNLRFFSYFVRMKTFINRKFYIHLSAWLTYLGILISIWYNSKLREPGQTLLDVIINYLCVYVGPIVVFYINYHLLVPTLLLAKKFLRYFLLVLALLGFLTIYQYGVRNFLFLFHYTNRSVSAVACFEIAIFFMVLLIPLGSLIRFIAEWFDKKKERIQMELSLLKFQISPHFLFNTLNNMYYLAQQNSPDTANFILKLSNIMRYMLKESSMDKVLLEKEVNFIKEFIELQKLRLKSSFPIKMNIEENSSNIEVSPMLLISFIENAFKHGDTYTDKGFITVTLEVKENVLYYKTENRIAYIQKDDISGIGMNNLKRRLELLYPSRHKLNIKEQDSVYTAELTIWL